MGAARSKASARSRTVVRAGAVAPDVALSPDFACWRTKLVSGIREEERRFLETVGEHRVEEARFWGRMRAFIVETLVGEGAVGRDELSFAKVTDSPEGALRFIEATRRV